MFRKLAVMLTCVLVGYLTTGEDVKSRQLTKEESTLRGDDYGEACATNTYNIPYCVCGWPPAWAPASLCIVDCDVWSVGALAYICNQKADEFCYPISVPWFCSTAFSTCGLMEFGSCPAPGSPMAGIPGWFTPPPGPITCGTRIDCGF